MSLISTGYLMYPDVLDGWSSETSKPTSLQHMRSTRVVSRQRKLDDFIKSELQRLNSRLDATDVRIQRLIGGEVPTNPKQFLDTWPEYKFHGHSGDQRFCCISLHFNLCGIQSHFHGSTPSARSTLRSPLAVYSNLRSLESCFFRLVCLIQFQPQVAKIIQHFHQIPCHPCTIPVPCCMWQDLNSQTSEPKDRFTPAPRAAKAAARRAPGAPGAAEKAGTKATAPLSRRGSAPTLQTGAASVWKILGKQWIKMTHWWDHWIVDCLWIVMLPSQCLFNGNVQMTRWADLYNVLAIGPNDALAKSPNLHAFKFS